MEIALTSFRMLGLPIFLLTISPTAVAQTLEDRSHLLKEAIALYAEDNYEASKVILLQVDSLTTKDQVDSIAAKAYYWLGRIGYVQRKGKDGVKWLKKAHDWFQVHAVAHANLLFRSCEWMGNIYRYIQGNPYQALPWFEKAFELIEQDSTIDLDGQRRMTYNLAATYRIMRDTDKAIVTGLRSLALAKQQNANQVRLASHLNLMGSIYSSARQLKEALKYFEEAIETLPDDLRYLTRSIRYRNNLAETFRELGNLKQAKVTQEQNLEDISKLEAPDPYLLGGTYYVLAKVSRGLGELGAFENYLNRAIETYLNHYQHPPAFVAELYTYKSWVYHDNAKRSMELADSALQILWPEMTESKLRAIDFPQNPEWELLFRALGRKARALCNLAKVNHSTLDDALWYHVAALEAYQRYRLSFLQNRDIPNQAEELAWLLEEAIESALFARQSLHSAWDKERIENLVWKAMELGKSFSLHRQLAEYQAGAAELLPKEAYLSLRQLTIAQNRLRRSGDVDSLYHVQRQLEQWHEEIRVTYPAYSRFMLHTDIFPLKDMQRVIPKGKILINFLEGEHFIYVMAVSPRKIDCWSVDKSKRLNDYRSFLEFLKASPANITSQEAIQATKMGHMLFQDLIQPVWSSSNDGFIISPHGILESLAFESLLTEDQVSQPLAFQHYPYLIREKSVQYAYSGAHWYHVHQQEKRSVRLSDQSMAGFAWGNASGRDSLPALPGSEVEIIRAVDIWKGKSYIGALAKEKDFRKTLKTQDILHIATHGSASEDGVANVQLIFPTADDEHDGVFHLFELLEMDLMTRVAILSACQSADGQFLPGEGLASLARGFAWSGCPSIVSNLWSGYDESAFLLMEQWHQGIKQGMSLSEALMSSKNHYISHANPVEGHPSRWAGVVLVGVSQPVSNEQSQILNWKLIVGLLTVLLIWTWFRRVRH